MSIYTVESLKPFKGKELLSWCAQFTKELEPSLFDGPLMLIIGMAEYIHKLEKRIEELENNTVKYGDKINIQHKLPGTTLAGTELIASLIGNISKESEI